MNIVWDTASTGSYEGTVFPEGICYSLVNNVCGVRYSLRYKIHSGTSQILTTKTIAMLVNDIHEINIRAATGL